MGRPRGRGDGSSHNKGRSVLLVFIYLAFFSVIGFCNMLFLRNGDLFACKVGQDCGSSYCPSSVANTSLTNILKAAWGKTFAVNTKRREVHTKCCRTLPSLRCHERVSKANLPGNTLYSSIKASEKSASASYITFPAFSVELIVFALWTSCQSNVHFEFPNHTHVCQTGGVLR